ncbi:MAG: LptF/LptG family permease [Bacteroides sp.]|nr:LptF/LptG family permease [Bacteroides sp.]MCM1085985.1 LptF/LptG family permease [Bacteroides sp.]MCM1170142.1 LptF/LptG family permease [Bacteroides sp.]
MKKIDKFVIKSFIGPLVLTFFIATFVLLLQFLWRYMDDLVGKGLPLGDILELLWYACWTFVPMSLPLAVLLSSLMVFGNFGEHYELVAMKAAGLPLRRAMRPAIYLSLLICGIAFFFANNAVPKAYMLHRQKYHEIKTTRPAVNVQEGVYYYDIPDYVIRVGKRRDDGRYLENVQIYDHSEKRGNRAVTMSNTGSMFTMENGKYLVFNLYDGYSYGEDVSSGQSGMGSSRSSSEHPFTRIKFDTQTLVMDLSRYDSPDRGDNLYVRHQKSLGLKDLGPQIDTLRMRADDRVRDLLGSIDGRSYYLNSLIGHDSAVLAKFNTLIAQKDFKPSYAVPSHSLKEVEDAALIANAMADDMGYYKSDIKYQQERLNAYRVEEHKKFSLSVGCLILFFIGAPLGALIRKGGMGMPVVVSVLMFIIYYMISVIGEKAAIEGSLTCTLGSWLATIIYLPFGLFLTLQATVDSSLLDADTWRRMFTKKRA